jgi:hypothetical protein
MLIRWTQLDQSMHACRIHTMHTLPIIIENRKGPSNCAPRLPVKNLLWYLHPLMIVTYSEVVLHICMVLVEPQQGPQRLPRVK